VEITALVADFRGVEELVCILPFTRLGCEAVDMIFTYFLQLIADSQLYKVSF
jgi:hypothetical protein